MSHGICWYICMHINADTKCYVSVIHDFYNLIFKTKYNFFTALGSAPSYENSGCAPLDTTGSYTIFTVIL